MTVNFSVKVSNFLILHKDETIEMSHGELKQWIIDIGKHDEFVRVRGTRNLWRIDATKPWAVTNIEWRDEQRPRKPMPKGRNKPRASERKSASSKPVGFAHLYGTLCEKRKVALARRQNGKPENAGVTMLTVAQWLAEVRAEVSTAK